MIVQLAVIWAIFGLVVVPALLYIGRVGDRRRADEAHYRAEERRHRFEQLGGGA